MRAWVSYLYAALPMLSQLAHAGDGIAEGSSKSSPSVASGAPPIDVPRDLTELYRLVKRFDFDERHLGNYESVPMHWERLTGPGLPAFAVGEFDESVGHSEPPSFKLSITTGSVGYEYRELDLPIMPDSDYLVVGFCRTQGLHRAAALMVAELVDQFGDPLPHTQTISNLIRSPRDKSDDWQRIELRTSTNDPRAFALRLQLWVLQDQLWQDPAPEEPDPIIRSEVRAAAWFDDISTYRMPRVRVRLADAAGVVPAGAPPRFELALNIAPAQHLSVELIIQDDGGQVVQSLRREIVGDERRSPVRTDLLRMPALSTPLPTDDAVDQVLTIEAEPVTAGNYRATLRILGRTEALMERQLRFSVLPGGLPQPKSGFELGLDLGTVDGGDPAALVALLNALGCNSVKLSIPFTIQDDADEKSGRMPQLARLVRELAQHQIEVTGELRGQERLTDYNIQSLRGPAFTDRLWARRLNPLLAQLGGLVGVWQLGNAPTELRDGFWSAAQLAAVRRHFRRFLSVPELAAPCTALVPGPCPSDIASIWVPSGLPTCSLGPLLEDALPAYSSRTWLEFETPPSTLDPHWRQIELARRIVTAKALRPERTFFAAPFSAADAEGAWQPTDDFQIVRTAFHLLRGRRPIEVLHPTPDSILLLFDADGDGCAVAWTWRTTPLAERAEYWFGKPAGAVDMRGAPLTLEMHGPQTIVPLQPEPVFIYGIDVSLARLATSFNVSPTLIEPHRADSNPVLTFRNTYPHAISGEIHARAPANWKIDPPVVRFRLEPGEDLSQPFSLLPPPRRFANTLPFQFDVNLETPKAMSLQFEVAMTVSLRNLAMTAKARREGREILVEQTLVNRSDKPVSFAAFLDPPVGPRQEAAITLKPGSTQTLVYSLSGDQPPGQPIALSLRENNGDRTLDLLVETPP